MTNLRIVGVAALLLAVSSPAMADSYESYSPHRSYHERADRRMPAQDFNHFDYGIARPAYHSGWSGPYGDGDYPGSVDQNMNAGNTFN